MKHVLFTDNLADLNIGEVCAESKKAGFDGIDLTLRPGGHVKPEQAEFGLAKAKLAADRQGIAIPMATTVITDSDSPHAEDILASCAHHGIRRIKLGYWRYEPFGTARKQIDAAKQKLGRIIRLARKYHVLPCVHVHSGDILANGGAVLYLILQDFPPDQAGAYVDPMHMTVEGGSYGWEIGMDLLVPWIDLVGIKNFRWEQIGRDSHGQMKYRTRYVPLADGQADLPRFMKRLREIGYDGIVSLHSEYKGASSFRVLNTRELLRQSAADLQYLRSLSQVPE